MILGLHFHINLKSFLGSLFAFNIGENSVIIPGNE